MHTAALAINSAAVAAPIPGDYDGNGEVEPADYQYWRERFGNTIEPLTSPDGNGNGVVDAADYAIWRKAFASFGGGGALLQTMSIPEPVSVLLIAASLAAGGLRSRSSRARNLLR